MINRYYRCDRDGRQKQILLIVFLLCTRHCAKHLQVLFSFYTYNILKQLICILLIKKITKLRKLIAQERLGSGFLKFKYRWCASGCQVLVWSFNKYLLSTYYMSITVLDCGDKKQICKQGRSYKSGQCQEGKRPVERCRMGMRGYAVEVDRESPSENMAQSLRPKKKNEKG